MALFRRRSSRNEAGEDLPTEAPDAAAELADEATDDAAELDESSVEESAAVDRSAARDVPAYDRSAGPFDESEVGAADEPDVLRLDLGSLRVAPLPGITLQMEVDQNSQQVRAVTALTEDSAVQLQVFAAPRSESLWDEVREQMLAELSATSGATVAEGVGAFGPELRAVIPARSPQGAQVLQRVRFTGIDGPRWFLRAVFMGHAAIDEDPSDVLHTLVRQTIVVRGSEAMAPHDPLPLRLPDQPPGEAGEADVELDEDDDATYADLNPFERGPEITETR